MEPFRLINFLAQQKDRLIVLPDTGDYPIAAETCRKVMKPELIKSPSARKVSCFFVLKRRIQLKKSIFMLLISMIIVWIIYLSLEIYHESSDKR